jgi:hypothetical protein
MWTIGGLHAAAGRVTLLETMATNRVNQNRADCISIEIGRNWPRFTGWLLAAASWLVLILLVGIDNYVGLIVTGLGAGVLPLAGLRAIRHMRRRTRTFVRTPGRLFLDGEPIELARVELRLTHRRITKVPTGYELSLWVMSASGPEDIPLGHYKTLLEASRLSGSIEEFVARANAREPRHA